MKVKNVTFDLSRVFCLIGWVRRELLCPPAEPRTPSLHHILKRLLSGQTPPSSYEKFYWSFRKLLDDFIIVTFSAKPQYERFWFNCAYFILRMCLSLDSLCSASNVYFFHSAQSFHRILSGASFVCIVL